MIQKALGTVDSNFNYTNEQRALDSKRIIVQHNCDCSAQQTPVEWIDHIQRFNDLVVRV